MKRGILSAACVVFGYHLGFAQDTVRLDEFLRRVEVTHPAMRMASFEPDLAEADVRNALGRFDPHFAAQFQLAQHDGSDKVNAVTAQVELPIDMLFGPRIKAQYGRGSGYLLNPERTTSAQGEASVGVSVPLFQGLFTDARRNALRKAELRPEMALMQFRMERNNLMRAAASKFWDWSEALEMVRVMDTLVALAERRLSFVIQRAAVGEAANIDSLDVLQEVLRRRGERLRLVRQAEQSAVDVAVFLWMPNGTPDVLRGTPEALPLLSTPLLNIDALVLLAQEKRPEVRAARLLQQTSVLDRNLASEMLRPFVEAEAGIVSYDLGKGPGPDLKFALKIDQPLFFRSASAQHQTADISVQRADWRRIHVERTVTADVQQAVIGVERSLERLGIATREVLIARKMIDVEERRLRNGEGDMLSVNLRERFYSDAYMREVSARADLARANVWLSWATGFN